MEKQIKRSNNNENTFLRQGSANDSNITNSNITKSIKGIIFDIGGVIIHYPAEEYYKQLSKNFNIPISAIAAVADPARHELELGNISLHEMLRTVSTSLNININDSEFIKNFKDLARTDLEMVNLIKDLSKNYRLYLLTNISKAGFALCDNELRKNNCRFDGKFASFHIHMRKPDPGIYQYVIREINLKPEELIFIDDKKRNIDSAVKVGINGIVFNNMSQLIEDLKKLNIVITSDEIREGNVK